MTKPLWGPTKNPQLKHPQEAGRPSETIGLLLGKMGGWANRTTEPEGKRSFLQEIQNDDRGRKSCLSTSGGGLSEGLINDRGTRGSRKRLERRMVGVWGGLLNVGTQKSLNKTRG